MSDIINLHETAPNTWTAKYQGNYGVYTIKIKIDGQQMKHFSCSCPSNYHPCKHILIIQKAIEKRIAEDKKVDKSEEISIEGLLNDVSHKELIGFVARQAKHNPLLTNTILLEFADQINLGNENKYSSILRSALKKVVLDYDSMCYDDYENGMAIDVLDEWLEKAKDCLAQKKYGEALLICKACIEEYAAWMENADSDIVDYLDCQYESDPFDIIEEALLSNEIDVDGLFNYCKTEMLKKKYAGTDIYDSFNYLLVELATEVNGDEFIELQDSLLKKTDRNSPEAQKIIQRKMTFYTNTNQPQMSWQLLEGNLQFEGFRLMVVEQKVKEKKYKEAKDLINDLTACYDLGDFSSCRDYWKDLILAIAQKEKDIPIIQKVSFSCIERSFEKQYYRIYKSTFGADEWSKALESIIKHYQKNDRNGSDNVANVLAEEKDAARLKDYIKKYLSIAFIEAYYTKIVHPFPEETLDLFRLAIDQYAHNNTGRTCYEHIASLFEKMKKIEGGDKIVTDMTNNYRILYKNRKAMIEILNRAN